MRKVLIPVVVTALVLGLSVGMAGGAKNVRAVNFDFKPATVTIQKGGKVSWTNREGVHTVTLKNGTFNRTISGDERVSKRFNKRGVFRYICRLHKVQNMKGKVIVE